MADGFVSPGYAVADQLQQILAQRRLDARQAMLDKITQQKADTEQQNIQSEIQARKEEADWRRANTASLATERAAREADIRAQEIQRRGGVLTMGQPVAPGDEKFFQENAPSLLNPAQPGTAPLGPDEQGPSLPASPTTFVGLPAQQEKAKKDYDEQVNRRFLDVTLNDPSLTPQQKLFKILPRYASHDPSSVLEKLASQENLVPLPVLDENTGKFSPAVDTSGKPILGKPGERPLQISRRPEHFPTQINYTVPNDPANPTGPTHTETHNVPPGGVPDFSPNSKTRVTGGVEFKGTAPNHGAPNPLYDKAAYNSLQSALRSSTASPEAKKSALNNFMNSITDLNVRADAATVKSNPRTANMSKDDLIKYKVIQPQPGWTDQQLKDHIDRVSQVLSVMP
jgi:hypothetical protein